MSKRNITFTIDEESKVTVDMDGYQAECGAELNKFFAILERDFGIKANSKFEKQKAWWQAARQRQSVSQ